MLLSTFIHRNQNHTPKYNLEIEQRAYVVKKRNMLHCCRQMQIISFPFWTISGCVLHLTLARTGQRKSRVAFKRNLPALQYT